MQRMSQEVFRVSDFLPIIIMRRNLTQNIALLTRHPSIRSKKELKSLWPIQCNHLDNNKFRQFIIILVFVEICYKNLYLECKYLCIYVNMLSIFFFLSNHQKIFPKTISI